MTAVERPLSATERMREWLTSLPSEPAERIHPFPGQQLLRVDFAPGYDEETERRQPVRDLDRANCVGSCVTRSDNSFSDEPLRHKPVLDIDLPVTVLPSSTPGHHHLFIDKEMTWEDYELLLRTLACVGIIEPGYLAASLERRHTAVRLPWVEKAPPLADIDGPGEEPKF